MERLKLTSFRDRMVCFLLTNMAFSVISNQIYSPFDNLTFAQPYLEQTFTWNSSVAQLSLACFVLYIILEFSLKVVLNVDVVVKATSKVHPCEGS